MACRRRHTIKAISPEAFFRVHQSTDYIVTGFDGTDRGGDIRLQPKDTHTAEVILSELYAKIEALQQHAEALSETDKQTEELETYDLLIELVPGKAAAICNQAPFFTNRETSKKPVDGFLDAMTLGLPDQDLSKYRGNNTGLSQMISQTARDARYPDYFEDIEVYLHKIEPSLPNQIPLLHGLTTISRIKDQGTLARAYYTRILDVDPADQIAKTNRTLLTPEEETG